MSANKPATPRSSVELVGATDLAKVDAHAITAEEYDEIPELTDEMITRADLYVDGDLVRRGRGRPRSDNPKQQVTMRLDADVLEAMRASGPGWQVRVNDALRIWTGLSASNPLDQVEPTDREARRAEKGRTPKGILKGGNAMSVRDGEKMPPSGTRSETSGHSGKRRA